MSDEDAEVPASTVRIAGPADSEGVLLAGEPLSWDTLTSLRHRIAERVASAGLTGRAGEDFVLAVYELMTNAVRHGGGRGTLRLTRLDQALTCVVVDYGGSGELPLVTTPDPELTGGRGLWLAQRLSDGLILTQREDGMTATVTACLPVEPAPALSVPLTPQIATVVVEPDSGDGDGIPRALA